MALYGFVAQKKRKNSSLRKEKELETGESQGNMEEEKTICRVENRKTTL